MNSKFKAIKIFLYVLLIISGDAVAMEERRFDAATPWDPLGEDSSLARLRYNFINTPLHVVPCSSHQGLEQSDDALHGMRSISTSGNQSAGNLSSSAPCSTGEQGLSYREQLNASARPMPSTVIQKQQARAKRISDIEEFLLDRLAKGLPATKTRAELGRIFTATKKYQSHKDLTTSAFTEDLRTIEGIPNQSKELLNYLNDCSQAGRRLAQTTRRNDNVTNKRHHEVGQISLEGSTSSRKRQKTNNPQVEQSDRAPCQSVDEGEQIDAVAEFLNNCGADKPPCDTLIGLWRDFSDVHEIHKENFRSFVRDLYRAVENHRLSPEAESYLAALLRRN